VKPNPFNPRQNYKEEGINELAAAMKQQGAFPGPLPARRVNNHYEIVYGHRRLRALKKNGVLKVELDVQDLSDEDMEFKGLIENLQREDLTSLEKAEAVTRLVEKVGNQREVAKRLGYCQSAISRLCLAAKLPKSLKREVADENLDSHTAVIAHRAVGEEFAKLCGKHNLGYITVKQIVSEVGKIKDKKLRDKVKQSAARGHIRSADDVTRKALELSKPKRDEDAPVDLGIIVLNSEMQTNEIAQRCEYLKEWGWAVRQSHMWEGFDKAVTRLQAAVEAIRQAKQPR
jgi:ParB family chromosome partitioning protein